MIVFLGHGQVMILFFCLVSLRSLEGGLMFDIQGLNEFGESSIDHVVIPSLDQVKVEDHHTRKNLLRCVNVTSSSSGISV